MQPLCRNATFRKKSARAFAFGAFWLVGVAAARAASLGTFALIFTQITNNISAIEANFDNSALPAQQPAALLIAPLPPTTMALNAASGTFFVQSDGDEIDGLFSAAGPVFELKTGKLRVELPQEVRGN